MRCILHIGLEKTGSTSIQATLGKNRDLLKAHQVLYPKSLGERSHVRLYAFASEDGMNEIKVQCGLVALSGIGEFRRSLQGQLEREISATAPHTVIISNEHCSSRLINISEISRLKKLLEILFTTITVVVYLRSQGESLRSAYSTQIKTGSTEKFKYPSADLVESRYDYDALLDRWETVFGKQNIDVRMFDVEDFIGVDVVTDFIERLGLGFATEAIVREPNKNVGLSAFSTEFLRLLNRHVPYTIAGQMNPLRGNLHDLVEQFSDPAPYEGDAKIMAALDLVVSDGNERVRRRYFPDRPAPLFTPPRSSVPTGEVTEVVPEAAIQLIARLWEAKQQQVLQLRQRLERPQATRGGGPTVQAGRRTPIRDL